MSNKPYIPDSDPDHPRWLLNLDKWEVFPYEDVEDEVKENGYGIVSYTWGMWSDFDNPAPDLPKYRVKNSDDPIDLPWKVPTIEVLTLSHARETMRKCLDKEISFVWWDWMCVPQGKFGSKMILSPELGTVKGEEIAKQMKIYQDARQGFIWLHRTNWDKPDSLKLQTYLKVGFGSQATFKDTLDEFRLSIGSIQEQEPWLTSGWTLQEGVLLQKSKLMDHEGKGLPGFMSSTGSPNENVFTLGDAAAEHLAVPATGLADDIATAFMRYSEGWTSDSLHELPQGVSEKVKQAITYFGPRLANGDHSQEYKNSASTFTDLIRCGLVAYWPGPQTGLYILSGASSRRFTTREDRCWALIGALELEGLNPWYSNAKTEEGKEEDFRKIKKEFFRPLLEKYQWELFIVPTVEDPEYERLSWFERIVHGGVLPLSLFLVKDPYEDLPRLKYDAGSDEIICTLESSGCASNSTRRNFIQLKKDVFARHYRQKRLDPKEPESPRGVIEVDEIKVEKMSGLVYLPVMDIHVPDAPHLNLGEDWGRVESSGLRCAAFELVGGGETSGFFKGIVDLWGVPGSFEDITSYKEFRICGSQTKALAEERWRCVMA
ncbi:hypothetical protein N7456_006742 [Penicillium angulare]|uniref:Heterokaryon incompatibility domain-containing protein n=1 Tax=Penicillium angulare TaxID=116970 RepID=A0A9W9FID1_9EURO|nr:hypothetical protein N7456_006742 [Penicillium angulare]